MTPQERASDHLRRLVEASSGLPEGLEMLVVTAGIVRDSEGLTALLVPEGIDCIGNAVAWLGC
jgi:hypothetical protein